MQLGGPKDTRLICLIVNPPLKPSKEILKKLLVKNYLVADEAAHAYRESSEASSRDTAANHRVPSSSTVVRSELTDLRLPSDF